MSTEPLAAGAAQAGALAASQRVRQLQGLIEQARQVADTGVLGAGAASTGPATGADFASALQAATAADYAPAAPQGSEAGAGGASQSGQYQAQIEQAAQRYGLDPAVLHGLIQQESGFDPNAQSSAGASGLTQLMPGTAASLGVANPMDPTESIEGGARYLAQMMSQFGGNEADALAAYNAGPGAVQQYGGVPPYAETQSYVSKVLGYAEAYRQSRLSTPAAGVAA
jgi:soluble lytic murein transglycosylase-like protein